VVAAGKSEFGVCGVVGGMMVIELLAFAMRQSRGCETRCMRNKAI